MAIPNPVWGIVLFVLVVAVVWYFAASMRASSRVTPKLATCRRCGDTYLPDMTTPVADERERTLCHVCRGEIVRTCVHCGSIFYIPPSFVSPSLTARYVCRSCRAKLSVGDALAATDPTDPTDPTDDPGATVPIVPAVPTVTPLREPPRTPMIPAIDESPRGVVPLRLYELSQAVRRGDYSDYPYQVQAAGYRATLRQDIHRAGRLPADDRRIPRNILPPLDREDN